MRIILSRTSISDKMMDCLTFPVGLKEGAKVGVGVVGLVVVGTKLGAAVGYAKIIWLDKTIERWV
jgi:hypothetical protein